MIARGLAAFAGAVLAVYVGWTVNGWRIDAGRTRAAEVLAEQAVEARVQADVARVRADVARAQMGLRLAAAESQAAVRIKTIEKKIRVYVPRNPACDLSPGAVGLLNDARGGVSAAPDDPPGAPAAAGSPAGAAPPR
jgi:hypothetical protein